MKISKIIFSFLASLICAFVFGQSSVEAIEFNKDDSGVYEDFYDGDKILMFNYDYTVKFNENTGFYNEQKIFDDGKLLDNQYFYSGQNIVFNYYTSYKVWGFLGQKYYESIAIHKYNFLSNNFIDQKLLVNDEDGSYTLNEDGLYRVTYRVDDDIIYKRYIYICNEIYDLKVSVSEDYNDKSVLKNFTFKLEIEDFYDLTLNKYYYAFGENAENLVYTEFSPFYSLESGVKTLSKEISVPIQTDKLDYSGKNKYLFVKVTKDNVKNKDNIVKSKNAYNLISKVNANVYIVDDKGIPVEEERFYRNEDVIKFKIVFDRAVKYSSLKYKIKDEYYSIVDGEGKEILFDYIVNESLEVMYDGSFHLAMEGEEIVFVEVGEESVEVSLIVNAVFKIDTKTPDFVVDFGEEYVPMVRKKHFEIGVTSVDEEVLDFGYYITSCKEVACDNVDDLVFDDTKAMFVNLPYIIQIDSKIANFDGDQLLLALKVKDRAGNFKIKFFNDIVLDNVIVNEEQKDGLLVEENILEENSSRVIGKKLKLKVNDNYNISKVTCYFVGYEKQICGDYTNINEDGYFTVLEIKNYSFKSEIQVVLEDDLGNCEIYMYNFSYVETKDGSVDLGDGIIINTYSNEMYEMSIDFKLSNYLNGGILLGNNSLSMIDSMLLEDVPLISEKRVSLNLSGNEELVVLLENVEGEASISSVLDLLSNLENIEKYNSCALSGNTCDINLYLSYFYKTNDIQQIRFVRLRLLDDTYKFSVEGFVKEKEIEVGNSYSIYDYNYISNEGNEVLKENVVKTTVIEFVSKDGSESVVNSIDTNKVGVYKISESYVSGESVSLPLEYVVKVVDKVSPSIKLKNGNVVKIKVGDKLDHDSIVEYCDNYDSDLVLQYEFNEDFDTEKTGEYVIKYWVEDGSGNKSEVITVTIVVGTGNEWVNYLIIGFVVLLVIVVVIVISKKEVRKQKEIM